MTWIKFHDELRRGKHRGVARALRFVFLELCHEARPLRGVVELPTGMGLVEGVHDILGGNRREVADALAHFTKGTDSDPASIIVEGKPGALRLRIPSWQAWNRIDESAKRTQEWRKKQRESNAGDADVTRHTVVCDDAETLPDPEKRREEKTHTLPARASDVPGPESAPPPPTAPPARPQAGAAPPTAASPTATERVLEALRSHPVVAQAAKQSPAGEDKVLQSLAEQIAGRAESAAKRIDLVIVAIGEAAADLAGSYPDGPSWNYAVQQIRRYADHARAPEARAPPRPPPAQRSSAQPAAKGWQPTMRSRAIPQKPGEPPS